jgi:hypothetical protein
MKLLILLARAPKITEDVLNKMFVDFIGHYSWYYTLFQKTSGIFLFHQHCQNSPNTDVANLLQRIFFSHCNHLIYTRIDVVFKGNLLEVL